MINGSAIPSKVVNLNLGNNKITGPIPLNLSQTLKQIFIQNNKMSGSIPDQMPNSLEYLYAFSNNFNGSVNNLPSTIRFLWLYNNNMCCQITSISPAIIEFHVQGNRFSGSLPPFPDSAISIYLGTSSYKSNKFIGTLDLFRPYFLYITGNLITDVFIRDPSQLTISNCDLSENPLLGNANIANLTCTKSNMYKNIVTNSNTIKHFYSKVNLVAMSMFALQSTTRDLLSTNTHLKSSTYSSYYTQHFKPLSSAYDIVFLLLILLRVVLNVIFVTIVFIKTPVHKAANQSSNKLINDESADRFY